MAYQRDKKLGDEGEQMVLDWLRTREDVKGIQDVSKDPQYQKKDIDILFTEDGSERKIDVKYDTMIDKTGNLFIELISNNKKYSPGNFIYSEADYFFYVFAKSKQMLLVPLKEARDYIYDHARGYRVGRCSNYGYDGKVLYKSLGRLVPYREILKNVSGTKIFSLSYSIFSIYYCNIFLNRI